MKSNYSIINASFISFLKIAIIFITSCVCSLVQADVLSTAQSSTIELTTPQQIQDFTRGLTFYATGGGGDPELGQKMLNQVLKAGKIIQIIDINQLNLNDKTICPFLMGTAGPETNEIIQKKKLFGLVQKTVLNMPAVAAQLLQQHAAIKLAAVVPFELGGASTPSSVATAAWLGIPVIDGDYTGRAMPEITNSLPAIQKANLFPLASADAYGNQVLITKTVSSEMAERLGKQLAIASFGLVGQANLLLPVSQAKTMILPHTLTKANNLGVSIRRARENKEDPIAAIIKITHAKILFKGYVVYIKAGEKEGYYVGNITINGIDIFNNQRFRIWFKNENLISWLNSTPYVTSPDLITIVDEKTGEPLINSQIQPNMHVVVFGLPAPVSFQSKEALSMVGPNHFGFNILYKPL